MLLAVLAASLAFGEPSVLSFNAAGIPVVHKKIGARMKAIGEELAKGGYDVVAFQEVWRDSDADRLAKASGLPYRARARQKWLIGDGLLILSRYPIRETKSLAFSRRTDRPLRLDGEQLAHKGALLARVETPSGLLDVYDVHFVADYKKYGNAEVRRVQARELAAWIAKESAGRPAVLAGDLNMKASDSDFPLIAERLGFADGCALAAENGCGASRGPRRIDFVLVPPGSASPARAGVALDGKVEVSGKSYPLSDHVGIFVALSGPLAALKPLEPAALAERR